MAKEIVVLDTNPIDGGSISVRCAMWFPVASGKEVPLGSVKSVWLSASAAENQAIGVGSIVEEVKSFNFPSTTTVAAIKTFLVNSYNTRSAYLTTQPFKGQYYGVYFENSSWSA